MATYPCTCKGCGKPFQGGAANAVWCTPGCKSRVQRGARQAEAAEAATEHPLVARVRLEVEAKGVADDVDGLLAVHYALAVAAAEASGKPGPVVAFREARARALGLVEKPAAGVVDDDAPEPTAQDEQLAQILQMADATRAEIAAG